MSAPAVVNATAFPVTRLPIDDVFPPIPYDRVPHLKTALPGPAAKAMVDADERFTSPSYTRMYPLAVRKAVGCVMEDVDGNVFLDFTAGIAVCATGHCHPRVVAAVRQQAGDLMHMSGTDFYYQPQACLARELARIAPGDSPKRVFMTNSGAESVEAALKLARFHTGRQNVIAFFGAFHGRTYGAMSLTGSKAIQRSKFGPLVPGITHVEYPNPYRPSHYDPVDYIRETLFKRTLDPKGVAAIFVEPIQGEGGYIVPPDDFLPRLRELTEEHGIMLVIDEVQAGMGRTGKMFGCQHVGVEPDIVTVAKGIASGLPLGAIVAKESVMDWPPGSHASTYGGNPVACVAALETIALLEDGLMDHATEIGAHLMGRLNDLKARHPCIGDVRGRGLMIGIEFVKPGGQVPDKSLPDAIVHAAFDRGLLLLPCGTNAIRFCPPLVLTREQADVALDIFDASIAEATA